MQIKTLGKSLSIWNNESYGTKIFGSFYLKNEDIFWFRVLHQLSLNQGRNFR